MAMNLIGEIAQYAIETDQIIRALAKERDDFKRSADALEEENRSLRNRISDGKKENERLIDRIHELQAVRNPDNGKVNTVEGEVL
jgi:predicted  nucleic acid-binding Zn-ribbon protein